MEVFYYGMGTYIVAAQHANDLATAVELDKQPLVEVLYSLLAVIPSWWKRGRDNKANANAPSSVLVVRAPS